VSKLPSVAIVTPSLNQGRFIEQTIASVLAQDYPSIEYIVRDAGSGDGTREVLERHRGRIQVVVEPDGGQADAINRGLKATRAEIVAWLNADDLYVPGAVATAVEQLSRRPDCAMVYGNGRFIDAQGTLLGPYPTASPARLAAGCVVCQPAAFVRRAALEAVGWLDPGLHYCMDYDLWLRLAARYPIAHVAVDMARYRLHGDAKSVAKNRAVMREVVLMTRARLGRTPLFYLYAYANLSVVERLAARRRLPDALRCLAALLLGAGLTVSYHGVPSWTALRQAREFERGPWPDPARLSDSHCGVT
jgi:glycosyltransferase involved in cell wall biosynthesis